MTVFYPHVRSLLEIMILGMKKAEDKTLLHPLIILTPEQNAPGRIRTPGTWSRKPTKAFLAHIKVIQISFVNTKSSLVVLVNF